MPLIPTVVLPEIGFLFVRDLGHHALERFVDEFADALLQMQDLQHSDLRRVQQIMNTYASAKFDLVDCCIMAMAERLQISQVCTFDRLISVFTARRIVNIWNFYLKPASIG
jgi:predicted nucleic acid-binding protein